MSSPVIAAMKGVFSKPAYFILAVVLAFVVFSCMVLFPNTSLVRDVVSSSVFSPLEKVHILFSSLGAISTNSSGLTAAGIIAVALLFGINGAMLLYALRKKIFEASSSALIGGGTFLGLLGAGCAACGTFLLGSVLSSIGAGALLAYLPLGGMEFLFLGILLLLISIYFLSRTLVRSGACPL